jgi:multimeric flavodoxin WrbA
MKVLILYHTKTGHTLEAANATAEGIRSAGSEADLVSAKNWNPAALADYDALIVGSPCWAGSVTSAGVAAPITRALDSLAPGALQGKRCSGISVHSGMGAETTVRTIGQILAQKGGADYRPGPVARAGVPLSLWKGPSVSAEDSERFRAFGAAFVA